ncbi:MAG: DUF58 domain-containing protein [Lachnospiraceae bacterium]|nr:DUF58 domain-containing protein [Lachnospiraceae bacterium]
MSYGIFAALTLVPVISLIYIISVCFLFRIYQELDGARELTAGKAERFFFTLYNESPIVFSGIRVVFFSDLSGISGLDDCTEYELPPRSGVKKQTVLLCRYRGEYEVGVRQVVIQDFFRLFTFTYKNREPFKITVKPDIIHLTALDSAEMIMNAARESADNKREPDVFVREYDPGDDPRLINWKLSAVQNKLMVRELKGEEQQGIGIIMDSSRDGDEPLEYLPVENRILETVIGLTLFFNERNVPVTVFYTGKGTVTDTVGRNGFDGFYSRMCAFSFEKEKDPGVLFREIMERREIYSSGMVFMVVRKLDPRAAETVSGISSFGIPVMVYVVSEDDGGDTPSLRIPRADVKVIPPSGALVDVI